MKIEKLNENKIKIILNSKDLEENKISIHSFMSNYIKDQSIFLNILKVAEQEVGFVTDDCQITVEALTQNKDNFTLIISKFKNSIKKINCSRLHASRKLNCLEKQFSLYKFASFEVFLDFSKYISENFPEISLILKGKNSLYSINGNFFLIIDKIMFDKEYLFKITCLLSEFGEFIYTSEPTFLKLKEFGNLIIEKNAINICA